MARPDPPEPKSIFQHFWMLLETPRPSKKEDKVKEKIVQWSKDQGLEYETDTVGNLIIRKPASKGCESAPGVCIQAHLDIVTSKNEDSNHNFDTDGIDFYIEGDWVKARGTTLGADNGIGVAAGLAVLEDKTLTHGPIECLFTVDEEVDMSGAEKLSVPIKSPILINVDSEEDDRICIGCAGGFETHYKLHVERADFLPTTHVVYNISMKGFVGGHTGCDIHQGRGSALKLLARVLGEAGRDIGDLEDILLINYSSGTAPNALPREASSVVAVASDRSEKFLEALNKRVAVVQAEFKSVELKYADDPDWKGMYIVVEKSENKSKPLTQDSTVKALDFISTVPHGVIRLNPDTDEVQTSSSFSICKLEDDHLFAHTFTRSSSMIEMETALANFRSLGRLSGAIVSDPIALFPGWDPNVKSPALATLKDAFVKIHGSDPIIYSVHAGLECGLFMDKYPNLDCVSIGPNILSAHCPDERLQISSVTKFWDLLVKTLEMIAKQ